MTNFGVAGHCDMSGKYICGRCWLALFAQHLKASQSHGLDHGSQK